MKKIISFIFLISIFSCTEIVNFTIPEQEPKLVVSALFNPDSLVRVNLFITQAISTESPNYLSDAKVELFKENNLIGILNELKNGEYCLNYFPEENSNYSLKISNTPFTEANSQCYLPAKVPVKNAEYVLNAWYNATEMTEMSRCNFVINDPPEVENFYEVIIYELREYEGSLPEVNSLYTIECNDKAVVAEGLQAYKPTSLLFSDKLFNGMEYNFTFDCSYIANRIDIINGVTEYFTDGKKLMVQLRSVSKSYFDFRRSWTAHKYNQKLLEISDISQIVSYTLTSEPVRLYTNIENGLGIFGGYSANTFELIRK